MRTSTPEATSCGGGRASALLLFLALLTLATACGSSVNWKNHVAFRATGTKLNFSTFEPDEVVETAVSTNLHYVSISLDAVFFRNLPGLGQADVALGFDITGVLGDGRALKTVLDTKKGAGENAFLSFDSQTVIEPFLYRGESVTINFQFTAVPAEDATVLKAQFTGPASDQLRRLNPLNLTGVSLGMKLYDQVFGFRAKAWQYSFAMFPADRIHRDKPDLLFTAGRHILIATPPADASPEIKRFKPATLYRDLEMRGNRLVWAKTEEEFTELPYIALNITRWKRYPRDDTELRKTLKAIDAHVENGNLDLAKPLLVTVGALINADPIITATEKNLERTLVRYREAKVESLLARRAGVKGDAEVAQIRKEIEHLLFAIREFQPILEPYETQDFVYRMNERLQRADEIARETKAGKAAFDDLRAEIAKAVKLVAAKPERRVVRAPRSGSLHDDSPPPSQFTTPLWKKWWFWTAIGVAIAGGVVTAIVGIRTETERATSW